MSVSEVFRRHAGHLAPDAPLYGVLLAAFADDWDAGGPLCEPG